MGYTNAWPKVKSSNTSEDVQAWVDRYTYLVEDHRQPSEKSHVEVSKKADEIPQK